MKKFRKIFRAKNLIGALCLGVALMSEPWHGSFLFLGEPKKPECLKEK